MSRRSPTVAELIAPGRVLIERHQLLQKIPLSTRTIDEMEKRGEFPKRFVISHTKVVWDLAEVDAWIETRKALDKHVSAPTSRKKRHEHG